MLGILAVLGAVLAVAMFLSRDALGRIYWLTWAIVAAGVFVVCVLFLR